MATDLQDERFDFRKDWILKKGDQIHCGDYTYTIDGEPLGYGGSSVLYPATRSDSELHYALKECFPDVPGRFIRENGVVTALNELGKKQLEQYISMLRKEQKYGQIIRNTTDRAVSIWDRLSVQKITTGGETFHNASDAIITVMERMDAKGVFLSELLKDIANKKESAPSLLTGGLPHIYTTACIMEQILIALAAVHKAGYVFGDISPNNIFFTEYNGAIGNVGRGSLLDFGSARPLLEDSLTAEITDRQVFSTKGYVPPEMETGNNGHLRLGKQADIYSVGRLMMLNLLTNGKNLAKINLVPSQLLPPSYGKAIGCSGKALERTNKILYKALQQDPKKRYDDAADMLIAIRELKASTEPPKFKILSNLSSPDYYVPHSRDKEIAVLKEAVNQGETVFIWGLGGIGKTEVAIKLAKELAPTKGAYLIHFQTSMRNTILQMNFSGYKYEPQKGLSLENQEEREYRERLEILRDYYKDAVIIVDNFDCEGKTLDDLRCEEAFRDFLGLDMQRVFTTRYLVGRKEWEIRELSDDKLLNLMRHYCTDSSVTDAQLLDLIHEVNGHTLTLALIAKTLSKSRRRITPEQIIESLKGGKLSASYFPKVKSDQNRKYEQAKIYEHLKALFNISGLSAEAKRVLCYATLLPDTGMDCTLFEDCLEEEQWDVLTDILECGWLQLTDQNLLVIHPVIREVCRGELKPSDEICTPFLIGLRETYGKLSFNYSYFLQIAKCAKTAVQHLDDPTGDFAALACNAFAVSGFVLDALYYAQKSLSIRLNLPSDISVALAYLSVANCWAFLGNYKSQRENFQKALAAKKHIRKLDFSTEVKFCRAKFLLYSNAGQDKRALKYIKKYVNLLEGISERESIDLAGAYVDLGSVYCHIGNIKKQLMYNQKAQGIFEKIAPLHPNLANLYTNTSVGYWHMGDLTKSLEWIIKAKDLRERIYPENHPAHSHTHHLLGNLYARCRQPLRAVEHFEKALEIHNNCNNQSFPDVVSVLLDLGITFGSLDEYEKQKECYERAFDVCQKYLPQNHPLFIRYYHLMTTASLLWEDYFPDEKKWYKYFWKEKTARISYLIAHILK